MEFRTLIRICCLILLFRCNFGLCDQGVLTANATDLPSKSLKRIYPKDQIVWFDTLVNSFVAAFGNGVVSKVNISDGTNTHILKISPFDYANDEVLLSKGDSPVIACIQVRCDFDRNIGGYRSRVRAFDLTSGVQISDVNFETCSKYVHGITLSKNGRCLYYQGTEGDIRCVDIKTGERKWQQFVNLSPSYDSFITFITAGEPNSVTFFQSMKEIRLVNDSNQTLWQNYENNTFPFRQHEPVDYAVIRIDSKHLGLIDLKSGQVSFERKCDSQCNIAASSPDATLAAVSDKRQDYKIVNLRTGKWFKIKGVHGPKEMKFTQDGKSIVSLCALDILSVEEQGIYNIWNYGRKSNIAQLVDVSNGNISKQISMIP